MGNKSQHPFQGGFRAAGLAESRSPWPNVLVPFDSSEAITTDAAAKRAGCTSRTIRNWCDNDGIGRKVGGQLRISRVALQMKLEDDFVGLRLYHAGNREDPRVVAYFARLGLLDLIRK